VSDDHGERLVRVETKLDIFLNDHETRIRKVERWQWLLSGAFGFISGGGGALLVALFGR
jgi:hypothetical protein